MEREWPPPIPGTTNRDDEDCSIAPQRHDDGHPFNKYCFFFFCLLAFNDGHHHDRLHSTKHGNASQPRWPISLMEIYLFIYFYMKFNC